MMLSILMYALMVSSLVALVGTLVVDAVRGTRPEPVVHRRAAVPVPRYGRGRLRERPEVRRAPTPAAVRARRGGTPHSCRR